MDGITTALMSPTYFLTTYGKNYISLHHKLPGTYPFTICFRLTTGLDNLSKEDENKFNECIEKFMQKISNIDLSKAQDGPFNYEVVTSAEEVTIIISDSVVGSSVSILSQNDDREFPPIEIALSFNLEKHQWAELKDEIVEFSHLLFD